ncbi:VOC family protein [Jeotgalicoccus sp. WY2]
MRAAMPFLTFEGRAFEALEYYKEVFHHFDIIQLVNYTDSNKVQQAIIRIGEMHLMIRDSEVPSEFTFTPSMSIY